MKTQKKERTKMTTPEQVSELVKRLRFGSLSHLGASKMNLEAADTIEAQAAELDAVKAENKLLNDQMNVIEEMGTESLNALPDCLMKLAPALVENGELKAENARLREALVAIDALDPENMIEGCSQQSLRGLVLRMGELARAALKGGE